MENLVCVHRQAALPGYPEPAATTTPVLRARLKMGVWYIRGLARREENGRTPPIRIQASALGIDAA